MWREPLQTIKQTKTLNSKKNVLKTNSGTFSEWYSFVPNDAHDVGVGRKNPNLFKNKLISNTYLGFSGIMNAKCINLANNWFQ